MSLGFGSVVLYCTSTTGVVARVMMVVVVV